MDEIQSVIRFENVGLRYGLGPEVLRDISFELQPGSFHFLVGESGAGKSSLFAASGTSCKRRSRMWWSMPLALPTSRGMEKARASTCDPEGMRWGSLDGSSACGGGGGGRDKDSFGCPETRFARCPATRAATVQPNSASCVRDLTMTTSRQFTSGDMTWPPYTQSDPIRHDAAGRP